MKSFKKALTNIRRRPYQGLAAVMVLSITFFVIIIVTLASLAIHQALTYFESRPQVLIFFHNDAPDQQITQLRQQLESNELVSQVVYVPQEEALSIYQELNKNDPLLLELVTADILPPSLEISTTNLEALKQIAAQTQNVPGVDEVVLRTDVVDILNKWLVGIRVAGVTFISILSITSLLIIAIVVGMKIASRNHEIQILKLLGANTWYIQGPYLIEGALYGFFSAFLANFVAITIMLYATPVIVQFAGEVPLLPDTPTLLLSVFAATVVAGTLFGFIGSWLAVKRYIGR